MTSPSDTRLGWSAEPANSPPGVVSLSNYADILRRRWKSILACMIIGFLLATAAFLAMSKLRPTYAAEALVTLSASNQNSSAGQVIANNTERQIATSLDVAERAKALLVAQDFYDEDIRPGVLRRSVTVTVPQQSNALRFRFIADGARQAAAGANAFAEAYLSYRREKLVEENEARRQEIQGLRAQREEELRQLDRRIAAAAPPVRSGLTREREVLVSTLGQLREFEDATRTAITSAGRQVERAPAPSGPASPRGALYGAAGLLLGLLGGLLYAFRRETHDERIRNPEALVRHSGARILAGVPVPKRPTNDNGLAVLQQPDGPEAEGHRVVAAKLQALVPPRPGGGAQRILVAGPDSGDGRVASNLALALARLGRSVVLLAPTRTLVQGFSSLGVSEATLASGTSASPVSPLPGLTLAPLLDDQLSAAVTWAKDQAEYVVVDGNGATGNSASGSHTWRVLALAGEVDGVVLVALAGATGRRPMRSLSAELDSIRARVVGSVLLIGSRAIPTPAGAPKVPRSGPAGPVRRPTPAPIAKASSAPASAEPAAPAAPAKTASAPAPKSDPTPAPPASTQASTSAPDAAETPPTPDQPSKPETRPTPPTASSSSTVLPPTGRFGNPTQT